MNNRFILSRLTNFQDPTKRKATRLLDFTNDPRNKWVANARPASIIGFTNPQYLPPPFFLFAFPMFFFASSQFPC